MVFPAIKKLSNESNEENLFREHNRDWQRPDDKKTRHVNINRKLNFALSSSPISSIRMLDNFLLATWSHQKGKVLNSVPFNQYFLLNCLTSVKRNAHRFSLHLFVHSSSINPLLWGNYPLYLEMRRHNTSVQKRQQELQKQLPSIFTNISCIPN